MFHLHLLCSYMSPSDRCRLNKRKEKIVYFTFMHNIVAEIFTEPARLSKEIHLNVISFVWKLCICINHLDLYQMSIMNFHQPYITYLIFRWQKLVNFFTEFYVLLLLWFHECSNLNSKHCRNLSPTTFIKLQKVLPWSVSRESIFKSFNSYLLPTCFLCNWNFMKIFCKTFYTLFLKIGPHKFQRRWSKC